MDPITTTRPPTPGDLAAKLRQQAAGAAAAPRPAPVLNPATLRPAPAAAARPAPLAVVREDLAELTPPPRTITWDRAVYERALRRSGLHPHARLLAFVLASLATPDTGRIPRRLMPGVVQLADACGVHTRQVHCSLQQLQARGWLQRAATRADGLDLRTRRAVALTLPAD
ncbi:hypothetical protein [Streptomyces phytophilus]|uniref:hypothetical protein n=1 Tax=Streptomyces phytophilus TaxID=722715 RepID=UPI0015F0C822|nr:hypothetical protein [Streptomyces phytophilus]